MSEAETLSISIKAIGSLIGILMAVLAWASLDTRKTIKEDLASIKETMKDLHSKFLGHDRRITIIETHCHINHGRRTTDYPQEE